MKHIFKLIWSALLIIIIVAGCDTDELHNMNLNPNAVNQIDMNYFFTAAQLSAGNNGLRDNRYTDWRTNIGMCAHAIQQLASTSTGTISVGDKYLDNDVEPSNAPWDHFFAGDGRVTKEIIKQTGPGGFYEGAKVNTRSAARILRVLAFHRLTDWYGSIPYFEANMGIDGIFQPKYDKQKDIYTDLLKELDEACAEFNAADVDYTSFKTADVIFKGDVAKWKKWGYSLMLRLAMRVSNVDAALAGTYVTKAVAGGVMTSNDDNVWVPMAIGPSEWTNQNGISRGFYPGDGGQWESSFLSKTLVDKLMGPNKASVADDDPRLMIFTGGIITWTAAAITYLETNPLNMLGLPNGLDGPMLNTLMGRQVVPRETFSAVNYLMMQDDEPYQVMNAAESEFLKAEAIVRSIGTGITGTAQSHYEAGVKLAMQLYVKYDATLTVSDAQVTTYLTTYPWDPAKAEEMIGTQMWLSKWMNWWDAWSDWRRTGFPVLVPTNYPGTATSGTVPVKLLIPAYEASGNPNYLTGATTPDKLTTKVWWDGGAE
jgi:hypothetical protein